MKKLYEFSVDKEQSVEETIHNPDGTKTIKAVTKLVPQKFFIRKPNRALQDEAEMFNAVQVSECIKRGCLTQSLLLKRIQNDGGAISDQDQERATTLYQDLLEKRQEFQRQSLKKDEDRTAEEKEAYNLLVREIASITEELQKIEFTQVSLFDQTAESIARNKTIRWWILMLAYKVDGDKDLPLFGDGNLEDRLKLFSDMEESEEQFDLEVLRRFIMYVSFWFCGRATKQADFESISLS